MPHRAPVAASVMPLSLAGGRPEWAASAEHEPPAGVVEDHRAEPAHLVGAEQAGYASRAQQPGDADDLRPEPVPGDRPRAGPDLGQHRDRADRALPDPGIRAGQAGLP